MSRENVEIAREITDAFSQRDPDAFVACLHPDVEWEDIDGWEGVRGIHRGRAEARKWFVEAFVEPWRSFDAKIEEIAEAPDGRVLLEVRGTARGRISGAETQTRAWILMRFADGGVIARQLFWTRDEALEAVGLRE
jgi:ketosteroid isomerase-like protein